MVIYDHRESRHDIALSEIFKGKGFKKATRKLRLTAVKNLAKIPNLRKDEMHSTNLFHALLQKRPRQINSDQRAGYPSSSNRKQL